jgi:hypothetical protein
MRQTLSLRCCALVAAFLSSASSAFALGAIGGVSSAARRVAVITSPVGAEPGQNPTPGAALAPVPMAPGNSLAPVPGISEGNPLPMAPQTVTEEIPNASPTPKAMGRKDSDQGGSASGSTTSGTEMPESGRIKSTSSYDNLGGGGDLSTTAREPSETRGPVKGTGSNQ